MKVYILYSQADGHGGQYSGITGIIDVFKSKKAATARMKKENGGTLEYASYKFGILAKSLKGEKP